MTQHGWARAANRSADLLRRGAWYPILDLPGDGKEVVIEVDQKPLRVSRSDLHLRSGPPECWSVVYRAGVMRPTFGGVTPPPAYAVCPGCRERQEFEDKPPRLTCQRCQRESPVDWTDTC